MLKTSIKSRFDDTQRHDINLDYPNEIKRGRENQLKTVWRHLFRLNFIHSFIRLIDCNYLCWQLSLVSRKIILREHLVMALLCLCVWMNVSEGWLQCILMMFWQLSTRKAKNRACNSNSAESPNIIPKENEKWFGNILLGIDTTHESISATV